MKKIKITDLTLRDAHQSLIATRMRLEDMLPIAEKMDKAGFYSLEVWGGATFDSCMRFLQEDPWERLRALRKAFPNSRLQMLLRGQNILGYKHYADDVVESFIERASYNGIDIFRVFDALNDLRNIKVAIKAVKKNKKHAQGTISYTVSPVHTPEVYINLVKELVDMGVDSICIKDMAGLLLPYDAYNLVKKIKEITDLPLCLHSHATTGTALTSLIKGIEAGADIVDTAISPFALQTSHSATESIVASLEGTEFDTGLSLEYLEHIAEYFKEIRKKYKSYETGTIIETKIFSSQVPGGMLSNLESQLKQQNSYDKLPLVLNEIIKVRKDFGYPPLVTPTSQIVGTQAVVNIMANQPYKTLTTESKNLLVGKYGRTPAEKDPDLLQRALKELNMEKPIEYRPADDLSPEMDYYRRKTQEILQKGKVKTEDILTYALFPNTAPGFFDQRKKPKVKKGIELLEANDDSSLYLVTIDDKEYKIRVRATDETEIKELETKVPQSSENSPAINQTNLNTNEGKPCFSPVTGTILKRLKNSRDRVKKDEVVLILEAMKVEFEIKSPESGIISYNVKEGDQIKTKDTLFTIIQ